MTNFLKFFSTALFALTVFAPSHVFSAEFLNDADTSTPPASDSLDKYEWPRIMMSEVKNLAGDLNVYTKYPIIAAQGTFMNKVRSIQNLANNQGHDLMYLRMFTPMETQEHLYGTYCSQSKAIPFELTEDTTNPQNCSVYAGHWLYSAGTTLSQTISSTSTTLKVANTNNFKEGQFIVVYDAPAGSFSNAEHMYVESINTTTNELILGNYNGTNNGRGFKSTANTHSGGSIVAAHVKYASRGLTGLFEQTWAYNMSSQCPEDAAGNQLADVMSAFVGNNVHKDPVGNIVNMDISGILFDVDSNFTRPNLKLDTDNNLTADEGYSPTGVNWWGEGVDSFYAQVRTWLPDLIMVGGAPRARGYASLNGNQEEGWVGWFGSDPNYFFIDEMLAKNSFDANRYQNGPIFLNNLFKQSSLLYPNPLRNPATSNSGFRLAMALAMLESGFYGTENSPVYPDHWYDEYSVDTNPGSPNYGKAIAQTASLDELRNNQGWMGKPLGKQKRIYNEADFNPALTMIPNGTFESNITGWSANNVNISRSTTTAQDGSASIAVSPPISFSRLLGSAYIAGPRISITEGTEYTIPFSVRASKVRTVEALLFVPGIDETNQPMKQEFIVPENDWARRVFTFTADRTGTYQFRFNVGREPSSTWFDSVYMFPANANVFRRDFEKGVVIANATPSPRTVNLSGTFMRIDGTQDPVNDGSTLTSVTLPPYDGAILVRPEDQLGVQCGAPVFDKLKDRNLYLWNACGTDKWFVRTTAGGSASTVNYSGNISNSLDYLLVNPFSLETSDTVSTSGGNINFTLNVSGSDVDGLLFRPAAGSEICFGENMPAGATVIIGSNNTPFPTPVNLTTYESCGTVTPPSLDLQVTADGNDASISPGPSYNIGDSVNWRYEVTNNGGSTLSNVKVFKQQRAPILQSGWTVACELGDLMPGTTTSCSVTETAEDGDYFARVSTQGNAPSGDRIRKGLDVYYQGITSQVIPELLVDIQTNGLDNDNAEPGPTLSVGSSALFTYNISNTGTVPLENIKVFDRRILPANSGFSLACTISLLVPGQSATCERVETVIDGQVLRQAAAQGFYQSDKIVNSDVSYYFGQ